MSSTLTQLRQRLIRDLDLGWIVTNADFGAAAAGSVTSANMFQNTNISAGYYKGLKCVIFRPGAASAADYIRYAGLLTRTSGLIAHTGASYADTTVGSEGFELLKYGIRPTRELVDSLNRALEFEFLTTHVALSHLSPFDGDMALSTDSDWTDVGTPTTSAKYTSSAEVIPWGPRAYELVGDAVNEGTRSTALRIEQDGDINIFAIASAHVGTASLQPYDTTNSAVFGTATTHSEQRPQLMAVKQPDVPATCKQAALNMLNTANPSTTYWNQAWFYNLDNLVCRFPATVTEGFMAPSIWQARPTSETATNVYDAQSFEPVHLVEGLDYFPIFAQGDAQPYKVRFANPMPSTGGHPYEWPLFVEARRPASDLTTFAETESATTNVAVHNLLPRWELDVLETILWGKIPNDKWRMQHDRAQRMLLSATQARPVKTLAKTVPHYSGIVSL